ncbi:tyrosine-type recombinase/integrase [Fusobacterium necrophorum]|uniref:Tyr recombinase domain-containing protein n=1 Tax=Fusobacterium necrophorum subsp. funduliforme TaxID=143387 RepID=A0A162J5H5_9FUSO|nr:site-specific integrase [Fusobacterium necrophorum]KYL05175.1 hypothetical protein A2J07_00135 [Fusobacterium necrophorum subsp. funduliforme]
MKGSVRKKGNNWYYSFDVSPKGEKRKRIERLGGKTKREAQSALRKAIEDFETEKMKEQDITILDLIKLRMEKYEPAISKTTTILKKKDRIRWFKYEENLNISFYDPDLIEKLQKFINSLALRYAQSTYTQVRNDIRSAYYYGINYMRLIPIASIKTLKIPKKVPKPRKLIYSEKEIEKALVLANKNIKMILKILVGSGMRIGEIIGLEVNNIDFKNRTITITKTFIRFPNVSNRLYGPPKTESSERIVVISEKLCNEMKLYLEQRKCIPLYLKAQKDYWELSNKGIPFDPLIRNRFGNAMNYKSVLDSFSIITKKTGIKLLSHSFRRTHASTLHEQHLPMENISNRLGHASLETTEKYIFETERSQKELIKILKKKNM